MISLRIARTPTLLWAIKHGPWLKPTRWAVQVGHNGSEPVYRQCWRWGLLCVSWGPGEINATRFKERAR